jgi:pyruvate kinase
MSRICIEAENHVSYRKNYEDLQKSLHFDRLDISMDETICNCAVKASYDIKASLIVCFTTTGTIAKIIQKYKPQCLTLAVVTSQIGTRGVLLSKGIHSMRVGTLLGQEALIQK